MAWQHIRIARFGGPEVLELAEEPIIPDPGPGEVRIKVLAAGTGFTDTFIRRGRYPDFKGPLPFTPGYDLVGVVEETGPGVSAQLAGQLVADLCVVGGYAQYAIRPASFLVPVLDGVDPAEAVCIPLAYLTAYQMLTRYRRLPVPKKESPAQWPSIACRSVGSSRRVRQGRGWLWLSIDHNERHSWVRA
jgi:NADPH:quinone reductase-like Zn-dependent oxidoreductase